MLYSSLNFKVLIINGFLLRYIRFVSSSFVLLSYCSVMDCVSEKIYNKKKLSEESKHIKKCNILLLLYVILQNYFLLNYIEKVIKLLNYLISVLVGSMVKFHTTFAFLCPFLLLKSSFSYFHFIPEPFAPSILCHILTKFVQDQHLNTNGYNYIFHFRKTTLNIRKKQKNIYKFAITIRKLTWP